MGGMARWDGGQDQWTGRQEERGPSLGAAAPHQITPSMNPTALPAVNTPLSVVSPSPESWGVDRRNEQLGRSLSFSICLPGHYKSDKPT